ncbi:MAG: HAMP domain-containing sensor histidine kinase, partial [bacterium]|nr:HAMP domain-containing sensor histidine kinase [bacterium]
MNVPLRILFPAVLATLFIIMGAAVVAVSTYLSYNDAVEHAIEHHTNTLKVLQSALYNRVVQYRAVTGLLPDVPRVIVAEVSSAPAVVFVRAVQPGTGIVLVSSNRDEVGTVFENMPAVSIEPATRSGTWDGEEVLEIFMRATASENLWMAVGLQSIKEGALRHAMIVGGSVFVALSILLSVVYLLVQNIVLAPVFLLEKSLKKVGEDDLSVRLPEGSRNEIGNVFRSFNTMTESVQKARQRDALVSKMKSEFLTIAAHQLRTPLAGAKWALLALLNGDAGEIKKEQREYIQKTHEANERMIALVNDLLDVTQIEEGKLLYHFEVKDMAQVTEQVVSAYRVQAHEKHISLTCKKPDAALPPVSIDEMKIRIVLQNLIENALSYTPPGGSITVSITYAKEYGHITVAVSDTGIGIPKEEQKRIFGKFFRAENAVRMR